ncbi:MAG: hypothetical protein KDA68_00640 [Planctomycetaceae bacterium]|nr:hypothetical protein [Planctomycetaceae bacterium]
MIWIGIDDTDIFGSPGTNQMARAIVAALADDWDCRFILRHQLLDDPRVPYTSKNGSASIDLTPRHPSTPSPATIAHVADICERVMRLRFVDGSDPGLCVASSVPKSLQEFGRRCQREVVLKSQAQTLAHDAGILLRGLGGTNGGVIGALAAVGLASTRDDGRVVVLGNYPDLTGIVTPEHLADMGITVLDANTNTRIETGTIDLVKKLRPNISQGRIILYSRPSTPPDNSTADWLAMKM